MPAHYDTLKVPVVMALGDPSTADIASQRGPQDLLPAQVKTKPCIKVGYGQTM